MKTRLSDRKISGRPPQNAGPSLHSGEGKKLEESITINRPPARIYAFWKQLENLPRFMSHLLSVTPREDNTSHWIMKTSGGRQLEWDARIIEDKAGQMISWQSLPDADVDNAGSVWFIPADGGRATIVKVSMKYSPPGGKIVAALARILGDGGEKFVTEDLSRLKSLLESGAADGLPG